MAGVWDQLNPFAMLGGPTGGLADDVTTGGLAAGVSGVPHPASPDHPLFWFAAFAGVTLGLIGASTHLRVGPFRAGFDAGRGS